MHQHEQRAEVFMLMTAGINMLLNLENVDDNPENKNTEFTNL